MDRGIALPTEHDRIAFSSVIQLALASVETLLCLTARDYVWRRLGKDDMLHWSRLLFRWHACLAKVWWCSPLTCQGF